tara:strand:- start:2482 stop:3525 length:1044 start_codon:yes stop_codon:yes gene_type:complete
VNGSSVLVTGASGFAAEHLIPLLRSAGYTVVGLDRKDAPSADCDLFISCDLADAEETAAKIPAVDIVIHMAAARADWGVSDYEFERDNVVATNSLLSAIDIERLRTFIFVSSISVMPQNTNAILDESAPYEPINVYGDTKMRAELACESFFCGFPKVDTVIVRPSVLYGGSDPQKTGIYRAADNNIFRLIDGIYNGRFVMVGDGTIVKTTAYVKNFCEALLFIISRVHGRKIFVYADYPPRKLADIVQIICGVLERRKPIRMPFVLVFNVAKFFDFFSKKLNVNFPINSSRVETFTRPTNFRPSNLIELGFEPPVNTKEALEATVHWYIDLRKSSSENFFNFRENRS